MTSAPEMHLYQSGSPESPAILFLHGSPLSGRMWQPQLESLAEFYCLAPDLPEHGLSAGIAPFDMDDTVRRLAQLIKTASPSGRAHVVGLSFGGVVAQALLSQAPEVVQSALLSGTAARAGKTFLAVMKLYLEINKPFLALLPPAWISALFKWQFGIPDAYAPQMTEDIQKVHGQALARLVLTTYADIQTPAQTSAPVLVVVGEKETPAAKSMARRLKQMIAGSRGVVAPAGSHVWNLQQPELFNRLLRAWVAGQPLPPDFREL